MSRRERQRRRHRHRGHAGARAGVVTMLVLLSVGGLALAGVVGWVVSVAQSAELDQLKAADGGANSIVYTHDGKRLGFINSLILRTPVSRSRIPDAAREATVAIEDRRFYRHKGIDYEGVVRAAVRNVSSNKTVQGGSTLTMQLVRNIYLPEERSEKSFERKIREAKLAQELEDRHKGRRGKEWILQKYLNSVPYGTVGGQTAVGIQAASRMFFDKPASKLTVAQAALLAGLPQAPSQYNPFLNPEGALSRRAEVLRAMVKAGSLSQEEADAAARTKLGVKRNRFYTTRREQFFFDYVTDELYKRYGVKRVRQGGLRITTTVDLKLQKRAREAIANRLSYPGDPASAIVSIDPRTGQIRAMASSATYGKTKFDYATQAHRQPGSTFKVMTLMAALRRGVSPNTTYSSHRLNEGWLPGYPGYSVETYSKSYGGSMNLLRATLTSDNTVYAQLGADVGPEAVRKTAYDMGIKTKLDAIPAETLGGLKYGVSPLEMANAYATIASGGVRHKPVAILKVVHPGGRVDSFGKSKGKRVFSDGVAYEATKILKANVQSGTGTSASIGCPAAGKTGTTSDYKDAWFVGYTPRLSTSVWVGYPNPPIPMRSVHGIQVSGSTFPSQIWRDYMSTAIGNDCQDFPPPKKPFVTEPFYGRFTGSRSYTGPSNSYSSQNRGYTYNGGSNTGTGTSGGGGTSSPYRDPSLYESPPQTAPTPAPTPTPSPAPAPTPTPSPGNGNGGGNGNGNGGGGNPDG